MFRFGVQTQCLVLADWIAGLGPCSGVSVSVQTTVFAHISPHRPRCVERDAVESSQLAAGGSHTHVNGRLDTDGRCLLLIPTYTANLLTCSCYISSFLHYLTSLPDFILLT